MKKAFRESQITKNVSCHGFRHLFATNLPGWTRVTTRRIEFFEKNRFAYITRYPEPAELSKEMKK